MTLFVDLDTLVVNCRNIVRYLIKRGVYEKYVLKPCVPLPVPEIRVSRANFSSKFIVQSVFWPDKPGLSRMFLLITDCYAKKSAYSVA